MTLNLVIEQLPGETRQILKIDEQSVSSGKVIFFHSCENFATLRAFLVYIVVGKILANCCGNNSSKNKSCDLSNMDSHLETNFDQSTLFDCCAISSDRVGERSNAVISVVKNLNASRLEAKRTSFTDDKFH